jgi:uncharacterized membrane protein YvbJ
MPYCPKCGNEIQENMAFCPRCGAPLKMEVPSQPAPAPARAPQRSEKAEKGEKQEKHEPEKGEKHEMNQFGFIGLVIGGLVLIILGFFAYLRVSNIVTEGMGGALTLLIIGLIVIVVGIYVASMARRHYPQTA